MVPLPGQGPALRGPVPALGMSYRCSALRGATGVIGPSESQRLYLYFNLSYDAHRSKPKCPRPSPPAESPPRASHSLSRARAFRRPTTRLRPRRRQ